MKFTTADGLDVRKCKQKSLKNLKFALVPVVDPDFGA